MNIIFLVVSCQIIFRRGVQVHEVYSCIFAPYFNLHMRIRNFSKQRFSVLDSAHQSRVKKKKIKIEDYIELVLKLFTDWFELHTADRTQKLKVYFLQLSYYGLKVSFLQLSYYGRPICALTFKK